MASAYLGGLAVAFRRWPIALLLFAASLLTAFGFSALAWT